MNKIYFDSEAGTFFDENGNDVPSNEVDGMIAAGSQVVDAVTGEPVPESQLPIPLTVTTPSGGPQVAPSPVGTPGQALGPVSSALMPRALAPLAPAAAPWYKPITTWLSTGNNAMYAFGVPAVVLLLLSLFGGKKHRR